MKIITDIVTEEKYINENSKGFGISKKAIEQLNIIEERLPHTKIPIKLCNPYQTASFQPNLYYKCHPKAFGRHNVVDERGVFARTTFLAIIGLCIFTGQLELIWHPKKVW